MARALVARAIVFRALFRPNADAVLLSMREAVERMRNAHLHIDESSYGLFSRSSSPRFAGSRNVFGGCR